MREKLADKRPGADWFSRVLTSFPTRRIALAIKRQLSAVILFLLASSALYAQTTPARGSQDQAAKTSIIIERQLVRFTTPGEAVEWRLTVTNQHGVSVFDSGLVYSHAIEWPLLNYEGQAVESGLYAYTLTTKAATAETARTQQGHLIIDRASSTDRVWLTSTQPVGLGAGHEASQVTVVGNREATLGGVAWPGSIPRRESKPEPHELPQRSTAEATTEKAAGPTATTGTVNRVAKFDTNGTSLIDSTISEVGGNVGIGTTTPAGGLDYRGSTAAFFTRDIGPVNAQTAQSALQLGLSNAGSRFAGVGPSFLFFADNSNGAKSFLGRVSGVWENPTAGAEAGAIFFQTRANSGDANALTERMRITAAGNVGLGTPAPAARLHVIGAAGMSGSIGTAAPSAFVVTGGAGGDSSAQHVPGGAGGAITLTAGVGGNSNSVIGGKGANITLQGGAGGIGLNFTGAYGDIIMQASGGNVGIGINSPAEKLHLEAGSLFLSGENQGLIVDAQGAKRVGLMKYAGIESMLVGDSTLATPVRLGRWTGGTIKNPTTVTADLVINSTGHVGIGTTSPQGPLQIYSAVEPPASSPAGNNGLLLGSAGEAAYKWVQSYGGALSLNPQGNNVGIGTTSPNAKLTVNGGSNDRGLVVRTNTAGGYVAQFGAIGAFAIDSLTNGAGRFLVDESNRVWINTPPPGVPGDDSQERLIVNGVIRINRANEGIETICYTAHGHIGTCGSSLRYKNNVRDFAPGFDLISRLRPVRFNWKSGGLADLGLIAEEVAQVEPLLVTYNPKGEIEGVKYDRVAVVLLNAVKEQQAQIKEQAELIKQQQAQLAGLKRLVCKTRRHTKACH